MSNQSADDNDDNDVMITEVTSAPCGPTTSRSPGLNPKVSNVRSLQPVNALNVMTKMGLNTKTNPKILDALKIMQGGKIKRGPKEKATFQRYMYCLPDKTSKLPRFSSSDECERAVVKQHQEQGYGYPQKDYNNGMPLRTHIDISLTEEGFDTFLKAIYPNLVNRLYDIYKIDKQRRLIRLDNLTPRAIKDMKYQGSLIIIPYDDPKDKPPSTLYRCISDNYALEYSRFVMNPGNTDETSASGSDHNQSVQASSSSTTSQQRSTEITCITSSSSKTVGQEVSNKMVSERHDTDDDPIIIKIEADSSDPEMETTVSSSRIPHDQPQTSNQSDADTSQSIYLKDFDGIFERTNYLRRNLKNNVFYIHIDENNLVHSFLHVYRQYLNILEHTVVVCCINHQQNENERHQQNHIQPYLVRFWERIFQSCFEGDKEKIPVCSPDLPEDLFLILGRVMYHGLVLHNYWPVKMSQAFCSVIMTDAASDKQLTESFQKILSEEQKAVVMRAKAEIRSGASSFEYSTQVNLCKVLRPYGNTTKPSPETFNECLTELAKFCIVQRPYWWLSQMRNGLRTVHNDLFQGIDEKDVFMFYSTLTPSALPLFEKIVYLFSTCEEDPELEIEEKRVKSYLENFIMSIHSTKLTKLLERWCHSDCLNSSHVYVRFSKSSISQRPIFDANHVTVTLSSVYTSQEEFSHIMSEEI